MHDFTIPLGPQNPMMKEPMCLRVSLNGNYIKDINMRLGYVHRGVELLFENKPVNKVLYMSEHICGICSMAHSLCFTLAIENMLDFVPLKKVSYIRMIISELERIHSHLLWWGFAMHELGYDSLFNYAMREREYILECFERFTGNRVHHAINKIGSTRYSFSDLDKIFMLDRLKKVEEKLPFYLKTTKSNKVIRSRLENVAILSRKEAKKLGVVGPLARASGIKHDIRKDDPYCAYEDLDFDLIYDTEEDAMARALVRLREVQESISMLRQICKTIPPGSVPKEMPTRIKEGEAFARVEAPRGENFHYYIVKDYKIIRGKVKTPTLVNIQALRPMLIGGEVGDIPVNVSTIDPCFGCMERVMVVKEGKKEVLTEDEFRSKYC
ncbi:MAG: nickel-dependent hydrogenase large subunit [Candidatus Woesearchaeota archaeon]